MQEFEGKVAVVTGAASGMGRAFAERFAQEGMRVVLTDVEAPALEATVTEFRQRESAAGLGRHRPVVSPAWKSALSMKTSVFW